MHAREMHAREMHAREMHAHEVHTCEAHTYEVHALEMHVRKVLGSPTLQTVVRWSICRDLSCKIRVLALRDKRSLSAAAPIPLRKRFEWATFNLSSAPRKC